MTRSHRFWPLVLLRLGPAGILLGALISLGGGWAAAFQTDGEQDLKVKTLGRVCGFVDWPVGAGEPGGTLVMGVMGGVSGSVADPDRFPMAKALLRGVPGGRLAKKQVEVRLIRDTSEIPRCRVLYVPGSLKGSMGLLSRMARKHGVLLVSDGPGMAELGVHINLVTQDNFVRFELNLRALKEAGFRVDPLLLPMALVVSTGTKEGKL